MSEATVAQRVAVLAVGVVGILIAGPQLQLQLLGALAASTRTCWAMSGQLCC